MQRNTTYNILTKHKIKVHYTQVFSHMGCKDSSFNTVI
jgi:hypothetical protein